MCFPTGEHMRIRIISGLAWVGAIAIAQMPKPGPRQMAARTIPVPTTVSPQIQQLIAAPLSPTWNVIPKTAEGWKQQVKEAAEAAIKTLSALRQELHVKV